MPTTRPDIDDADDEIILRAGDPAPGPDWIAMKQNAGQKAAGTRSWRRRLPEDDEVVGDVGIEPTTSAV